LSFPIVVGPHVTWRHARGRTDRRAASVTLLDIEPAIWRQLVIPWRFHLGQLHRVIQAAFGWWDSHLHQFMIGGLRYGDPEQVGEPEFEDDARSFDETAVRLRDFGRVPDQSFLYLYVFGDHWQHHITFERRHDPDPATLPASPAPEPAHPRTSAVLPATPTSSRSSPIPAIPSTARH
jgi:hypothetical protein